MWIHLLRHGIAVDREDPACPADPERYLTERGRQRTRAAARGMAVIGIRPELVLVSPYVRAQETADIAIEELGLGADLVREATPTLTPMEDPADAAAIIGRSGKQSVMCVGHLPHLDALAAYLVGASNPITSLKKAGLATIQCDSARRGAGWLFAVHPPAVLRRLGGES